MFLKSLSQLLCFRDFWYAILELDIATVGTLTLTMTYREPGRRLCCSTFSARNMGSK